MEYFALKKPNLKQVNKEKVFRLILEKKDALFPLLNKTAEPEYLYWDDVQYKELPEWINKYEFWFLVKFYRESQSVTTLIKDKNGGYFQWIKLQKFESLLHDLDLNFGGNLVVWPNDLSEKNKNKLIARGTMEEAIASSQLEGANTTRRVAKQMLREGRKPKNKSEQMIINNYETMLLIEEKLKDKELNRELLFELHGLITKNTLNPNDTGRLRTDDDEIIVLGEDGQTIYHTPPTAEFVKNELENLYKFANDIEEKKFIHPLIKAIMLHFWIGYLHPFVDGNGRLARVLFYWYLLKKGYWAFAFLPISTVIKKSPVQYKMAYIYTEQDGNDLTYFIDYNIKKIQQSTREMGTYIKQKSDKNKNIYNFAQKNYQLNDRQLQLLQYLHENKGSKTTSTIHKNVNQVSKITAINDLKTMVKLRLLLRNKIGKNVYYSLTEKVSDLLAE